MFVGVAFIATLIRFVPMSLESVLYEKKNNGDKFFYLRNPCRQLMRN